MNMAYAQTICSESNIPSLTLADFRSDEPYIKCYGNINISSGHLYDTNT